VSGESALFVSTFSHASAGAILLCLHGIEAHGFRFAGLAQRLPAVTVVAPDLRGHGRSPMVGPWTLEQHIYDLGGLLNGLGPDTTVLGHSYGGLIAWELARAHPTLVRGLVLVDPAINVDADMARTSAETYTSAGRTWPSATVALDELMATHPPSGHWSVALDVALAMWHAEDGSVRPMLSGDAVRAAWSQMQQPLTESGFRGPTLLLEAAREQGLYVSATVVESMRAQLGESLTHFAIDATHSIPSDFPDLLATHVQRFLDSGEA
jgi:lipase